MSLLAARRVGASSRRRSGGGSGGTATATVVSVPYTSVGTGEKQWEYSAGWTQGIVDQYTSTTGATSKVRWHGLDADIYVTADAHHGQVEVLVDGTSIGTFDQFSSVRAEGAFLCNTGALAEGLHTVTVRNTGTKNPSSTGNPPVVTIARAEVKETARAQLWRADMAKASLPEAYNFNYVNSGYAKYGSLISSTSVPVGGGKIMRNVIPALANEGYRAHNEVDLVVPAHFPRNTAIFEHYFRVNAKGGMEGSDCKVGLGLVGAKPGATNADISYGGTKLADSWSARTTMVPPNYLHSTPGHPWCMAYYLYAWKAGGQTYVDFGLRREYKDAAGNRFTPVVGTWYKQTIEYGNNTAGVADGIYKVWIDDVLFVNLTDVQWNESIDQPFSHVMVQTFANKALSAQAEWDSSEALVRAK